MFLLVWDGACDAAQASLGLLTLLPPKCWDCKSWVTTPCCEVEHHRAFTGLLYFFGGSPKVYRTVGWLLPVYRHLASEWLNLFSIAHAAVGFPSQPVSCLLISQRAPFTYKSVSFGQGQAGWSFSFSASGLCAVPWRPVLYRVTQQPFCLPFSLIRRCFILGALSRIYFCVLRMAFYLIFLASSEGSVRRSEYFILLSLDERPPRLSSLPKVILQAPEVDSGANC